MGMGNVATVNTLNSVKEPTGACAHVQYMCTMLINKFALYAYASVHKNVVYVGLNKPLREPCMHISSIRFALCDSK